VGECFFWYRPTRVVPDKRPLNGCVCVCVYVCVCVCVCVVVVADVSMFVGHNEDISILMVMSWQCIGPPNYFC